MSEFSETAVDLRAVPASGDGVAWSAAPTGVNVNLVVLHPGGSIGEHRNDEVDVVVVAVAGAGAVTIDGEHVPVADGTAVVVPRATTRSIAAGDGGLRYLTVHRARGPLGIRSRQSPE